MALSFWGLSKFLKAPRKQWLNTAGHVFLIGGIPSAVACYFTSHEGFALVWIGSFAGFTVAAIREFYHSVKRGKLNLLDRYRDIFEAQFGATVVGAIWAFTIS